ncbi:MAG: alpha/beta fold hydrolase [bacterium]
MSMEEKYIDAGEIRTCYWVAGDQGPSVVLIHGLGTSKEIWRPNIEVLARAYRVYAPDLVGHGFTDKPDSDYSISYMIGHLHHFMKAMRIDQAAMIGVSLGGGLVLRYAIDYPHRVRKLVPEDAAGLGRDVPFKLRISSIPFIARWSLLKNRTILSSYMKGLVLDPAVMTEEIIDHYHKIFSLEGAMNAFSKVLITSCGFGGVRKELVDSIVNRLSSIKIPTLIAWGREDPSLPVKHAYVAQRNIPHSELYVFENCGHFPNLEKTEEFNRVVMDFLAK